MFEIDVPGQGHTMASMLREALFAHGAKFAACIVPHPQDEFLRIQIDGVDNPAEVLLETIRSLQGELSAFKKTVKAHQP